MNLLEFYVCRLLARCIPKLEEFEVAALANLLPGTAEEAKKLIPSLATKFNDEELDDVLHKLTAITLDRYNQ